MELYIIRHADPDYENDTITPYGKEQADLLAKRIEKLNPDFIYSSPRGRAIATAKPSCELLGKDFTIEEWTTEKMRYMRIPDLNDKKTLENTWSFSFDKGLYEYEDFAEHDRMEHIHDMVAASDEFLARHGYIREGLYYKIDKPNDDKIAVFCHGGFGAAWIAHLVSLPPTLGWLHFIMGTTAVTKVRFDNNESGYTFPRMPYFGDREHLKKS